MKGQTNLFVCDGGLPAIALICLSVSLLDIVLFHDYWTSGLNIEAASIKVH